MQIKFKAAMILAALALMASGLTAFANQGNNQGAERDPQDLMGLDGESTLLRNNNGIQFRLKASGLEPGHVATIWWVLFEDGEAEFDNGMPTNIRSAFYAAGSVVGGSGKANFAASLMEDQLKIDDDFDANQLVVGDAEDAKLDDARAEDVLLVVRTHGPKLHGPEFPGLVNQMLNTHDAGCTTVEDGEPREDHPQGHPLTGHGDLPDELWGPNMCMNLATAFHAGN